jgi:hypothetical protein
MRRWRASEAEEGGAAARTQGRGIPTPGAPCCYIFFRQIEEGMEDLDVLPLMFGCDLLLLCGCMKNDKQVSHIYFDLL